MNKSAARTIDILELLSKNKKPMTLTEIGNSLDIPKSSCFDIVYTLVDKGVLEVDNEILKTFRLSIKIFQIGTTVLSQSDLHSIAHPLLINLAKSTGYTVYLAIEDKSNIVYLDKVESDEPIRSTLNIGSRNDMHVTGLGKALLATYPNEKVRMLAGNEPLKTYTSQSISTLSALEEDLQKIRFRGYAIDDRESMDYVRCLATPIRDYQNKAVAAISIAALDFKLPMEKIPEISLNVIDTAMQISRRLGFIGETLYYNESKG